MKIMQKPEIEFIKYECRDVITTSGGPEESLLNFPSNGDDAIPDTTNDKSLSKAFGQVNWNQ